MSEFDTCYTDSQSKKNRLLQLQDELIFDKDSVSVKKTSPPSSTSEHIDSCVSNCKTDACRRKCASLKRGIDHPIFFESPFTYNKSQLAQQFEILETNLIGTLITGKGEDAKRNVTDRIMGKNYIYPMDKELKVPLTGEYVNANCTSPDGSKKRRNMYIRGIPRGDVAKYVGLNLNLPVEPVDWRVGQKSWKGLFEITGKEELHIVLKDLKKRCFSFLYDVNVATASRSGVDAGDWDPVDKLRIPPKCERILKKISPGIYKKILNYDSSIFGGSLKGLLPSIVEDVVDLGPASLIRKSGIFSTQDQDKCVTATQPLGEAVYGDLGDLKNYNFEVFTNYSKHDMIKIICMLIVLVALFLNLFYNIE